MIRLLIFCVLLLAFALQASAALTTNFNATTGAIFANSGYVLDNNLSGWSDTRNLDVDEYDGLNVANVQVTLQISGGWNGDLYGYLVHETGFVVLLDRVGSTTYSPFGYGEAGFTSLVLADDDVHTSVELAGASQFATGTPWATSGPYNSQDGTLDAAFLNTSVNGDWTLFLADRSSGDISQVTSWGLTIEAVPEPTTWAMMFFGAAFGGWRFSQWRTKRG